MSTTRSSRRTSTQREWRDVPKDQQSKELSDRPDPREELREKFAEALGIKEVNHG